MRLGAAVAIVSLVILARPAVAHQFSTSYSRVVVSRAEVRVTFIVDLLALHSGPAVDADGDGAVTYDELDAAIERVFAAVKANYRVLSEPAIASTSLERFDLVAENTVEMEIVCRASADIRRLEIASTLDRITQPDHTHLLRMPQGSGLRQAVLTAERPVVEVTGLQGKSLVETVVSFVRLGVEHIFGGYDHLAFLVGLLACAATFTSLLKIVTSFTVAHSLTLGLATFDLVWLPSRLVESLIALSIAYVAVENLSRKTVMDRWRITFLFGLVHGLGFSNVLRAVGLPRRDLATSLFSFNLGVEIGQLAFVATVFPLILCVGTPRWQQRLTTTLSLAIMTLGIYWFVQRAFMT